MGIYHKIAESRRTRTGFAVTSDEAQQLATLIEAAEKMLSEGVRLTPDQVEVRNALNALVR